MESAKKFKTDKRERNQVGKEKSLSKRGKRGFQGKNC